MAFGIDDALTTVAAGISLTETIVATVRRYKRNKQSPDLELLLEEVRVTALRRIDEADLALTQFERMLIQKNVDINKKLSEVIAATPFWHPFEQHQLNQIQKSFNVFWDSVYSAGDDIAALVRCRDLTAPMGEAIVESAHAKHELHEKLLYASSLKEAIGLLRNKLIEHKNALNSPGRPGGRTVRATM
jgi:hypothetical protein